MPFTASHAIVAIPFARTPLPAGAVAIGAMAPDLPLFFPWVTEYRLTHGVPSLLWTAVPIALVPYAVWRLVIRPAASGLLPARLARALPIGWDRVRAADARRSPVVVAVLTLAAAIIGVATHVFWDGFAHRGRFGVDWLPVLGEVWGPLDGTQWLQYGSSVLGLTVIAGWAAVEVRRRPAAERVDRPAVRIIRVVAWAASAVALLAATAVAVARDGDPSGYRPTADFLFDVGTGAGALILVVVLAASVAIRMLRRPPEHAVLQHSRE